MQALVSPTKAHLAETAAPDHGPSSTSSAAESDDSWRLRHASRSAASAAELSDDCDAAAVVVDLAAKPSKALVRMRCSMADLAVEGAAGTSSDS